MSNAKLWKTAAIAGAVLGGTAMITSAAVSGTAAYFARRVVTRDRVKGDNTAVVEVGAGTVTLRATADTVAPGRYGLWASARSAHVRLGEVISTDPDRDTVTRELIDVDCGTVTEGPARWNPYYLIGSPRAACGLEYADVTVRSSVGDIPTWYIPAEPDAPADTWAVCVHGHGATREECLRAIPLLHRLGLPVLVPSYRNSSEGPVLGQGRYQLGDTEWEDIEAAVVHALSSGAKNVVMFGWSMGGAIVLQMVSRSWVADRVQAMVLDSPVVDWTTVITHQAKIHKIPAAVGRLGLNMIGHPAAKQLVGTEAPVDLDRMDWVRRAAELRLPLLVLHSPDDTVVPHGPSVALAHARPDLVTYAEFPTAGHTRTWNTDPERWEREVARFLLGRL